MQCGCPECGVLMTQLDKGLDSTCKCSWCGHVCRACMGGQKGANVLFKKGMSQEEWDILLRMRAKEVDGK